MNLSFYRTSHVRIPYFISVTDRREIIGNDDFSSDSNSESVVEMFDIPPLGWQSQQQRHERSSSSPSNTTTNSTHLPATDGVSNVAHRRVPLRPFVYTTNGRTGIRSTNHANGLIGILQIAGAHPSGLIGTLRYNNWQTWLQENVNAIFQCDGLLGMFNQVSHLVLARHFSMASTQAKRKYMIVSIQTISPVPPMKMCRRGHSNSFICLKPSRIFLPLPRRQQRLGVRGAV